MPIISDKESRMVKDSIHRLCWHQPLHLFLHEGSRAMEPDADERNGVPIGAQENSYWLYIVPWGINKAVTYVKETYGNPMMILSENEWTNLATSISPRVSMILQESDITEIT
ncbi:hypothetical protein EE612_017124 [Oryza sativa]|nr:hypothetical protein EE612_017124 [Oryza sativa]